MLHPLALLSLILLAAPAAAAPSPDSVTRDIAARIRAVAPGHDVRITGPLTIVVVRPGADDPLTLNADRVWNVCRQGEREACDASAANFVASMGEWLGDRPPLVRAQLREMVRSEAYCVEVRRLNVEADRTVLTRPAPGGLCAVLVADSPRSMRLLAAVDLIPLGLTAEEAWPLAQSQTLANLPQPMQLAVGNGLVMLVDIDYLPSLILASEGWQALAAARGEIMLAVPADGELIVFRAADLPDLQRLRALVAEDFQSAERGISPLIYRWTDSGWRAVE